MNIAQASSKLHKPIHRHEREGYHDERENTREQRKGRNSRFVLDGKSYSVGSCPVLILQTLVRSGLPTTTPKPGTKTISKQKCEQLEA